MRILVHVCSICEQQFHPDRNTRGISINGQVMDICSARCAALFWEKTYWQSADISLVTKPCAVPTEVKEFKVVK